MEKHSTGMYSDVTFDTQTSIPKLWPDSLLLLFGNHGAGFKPFVMGSKPLVSAKHKMLCIDLPSIFSDTLLVYVNHHSTPHLCPSAQMCYGDLKKKNVGALWCVWQPINHKRGALPWYWLMWKILQGNAGGIKLTLPCSECDYSKSTQM